MENGFVRETVSVIDDIVLHSEQSWGDMLGQRYILSIGLMDMKMEKGPLLKRTFFAICGMTDVDTFDFLDRAL